MDNVLTALHNIADGTNDRPEEESSVQPVPEDQGTPLVINQNNQSQTSKTSMKDEDLQNSPTPPSGAQQQVQQQRVPQKQQPRGVNSTSFDTDDSSILDDFGFPSLDGSKVNYLARAQQGVTRRMERSGGPADNELLVQSVSHAFNNCGPAMNPDSLNALIWCCKKFNCSSLEDFKRTYQFALTSGENNLRAVVSDTARLNDLLANSAPRVAIRKNVAKAIKLFMALWNQGCEERALNWSVIVQVPEIKAICLNMWRLAGNLNNIHFANYYQKAMVMSVKFDDLYRDFSIRSLIIAVFFNKVQGKIAFSNGTKNGFRIGYSIPGLKTGEVRSFDIRNTDFDVNDLITSLQNLSVEELFTMVNHIPLHHLTQPYDFRMLKRANGTESQIMQGKIISLYAPLAKIAKKIAAIAGIPLSIPKQTSVKDLFARGGHWWQVNSILHQFFRNSKNNSQERRSIGADTRSSADSVFLINEDENSNIEQDIFDKIKRFEVTPVVSQQTAPKQPKPLFGNTISNQTSSFPTMGRIPQTQLNQTFGTMGNGQPQSMQASQPLSYQVGSQQIPQTNSFQQFQQQPFQSQQMMPQATQGSYYGVPPTAQNNFQSPLNSAQQNNQFASTNSTNFGSDPIMTTKFNLAQFGDNMTILYTKTKIVDVLFEARRPIVEPFLNHLREILLSYRISAIMPELQKLASAPRVISDPALLPLLNSLMSYFPQLGLSDPPR